MGFKNNHQHSNDPVLRRGKTTKMPDAPPSVSFNQSMNKEVNPQDLPPHHEVVMSVNGDTLSVPTLTIIEALPKEYLHQNWHNQLESAEPTTAFNKDDVLNVLKQGAFKITVGPLACLLPNTLVTSEGYHSTDVTELPLDELLEVIPKNWLINPYQSCALEDTIADMDNPFDLEHPTAQEEETPKINVLQRQDDNKLSKPTVLPKPPTNNDPDMAITQEMELPKSPDFISSSQAQCPETAQFSVSDFWDKEKGEAAKPQAIKQNPAFSTQPEQNKLRRKTSSIFDIQETEQDTLVVEVDESEPNQIEEVTECLTPKTNDKSSRNQKTDFDLSTPNPNDAVELILEDPKQTVCMYTRPPGDIVIYAQCISFTAEYILGKIDTNSHEFQAEDFLEITQQDLLDLIKEGSCKIPQAKIHSFLNLPNGSQKVGDLELPLSDILTLIPTDWYVQDQVQELDNILLEMDNVFTEEQIEELAQSANMEPQLESIEDEVEEESNTTVDEISVVEEPLHEKISTSIQDDETRVYSSEEEGGLMDDLIGANSSIMSFLQGSDTEDEELNPHDTAVLEEDKSGLSNDIKTHKTIHIGLSKADEIKEAPPIQESLVKENTSLDFVNLEVEDDVVGKKAGKGRQNPHFRKPPKPKTVASNEYDMELHNLIENREQSLNPHAIPNATPPERKATKKSNHPHVQESSSVAPNGIRINQCSLEELLLICDESLAKKVLDARTEPYPSLESLKHQAELSDDEYQTLTGLSPKEYHIQKETYLFSIAGETNDATVNTFIKQLKDKCEFDFIMLSTLDGLNITDCGTTNSIDKEELAAYIPKLISTKKEFLENTNIHQADDFSFYLGDSCLSVSIAGNVFFTCIHSSPWPNTNQLKFLHGLRDLVAWYFSYRLIL
ncbi:hypothetical protein PQO01_11765 [Lentisphaera marina]|uniref:hypothetical protein n=1 Tax=Lentisphaera marina TaxID=1111041 RepID=UPI002365A6A6|nr:hypothetical protein [Lentisphaera marina]MDD7985626.1 hypothetical protein [Lentisphaera marina]